MSQKYRLHHIFYNFDTGGAQKRLKDFIQHTQNIFTHHITALNGDYRYFKMLPEGAAQIYPIPYQKGYLLKNIKTIRQHIKKLHPSCVLTHNFGSFEAVIANTLQLYPHIHNEDGFGSDEKDCLKYKRNWMRKIFLMHKITLVPSQTLENIAKKKWASFNNPIHYVPNGVPDFIDYPQCPFHNYGKMTIGTVAICRPEKDLGQFIQLISDLKQAGHAVFGVLVGDGSELMNLKNMTNQLGLTDQDFLFTHYQENYRAYMAYFDIFALTSLTEQQPFSILDAMACGLPIIATNVGDIANMVSTDNIPYIDTNIFTNNQTKIIELLNNSALKAKLAHSNNQKYQQSFQLSNSLDKRKHLILSRITSL